MSSSNLIRWSGLATLVSGVLWAVLSLAFFMLISGQPESVTAVTSAWKIVVSLELVAGVLTLMALMGLYARLANETGTLGLIAFAAALSGTAMMLGFSWTNTFAVPALAVEAPKFLDAAQTVPPLMLMIGYGLTFSLFALGWFLFGLAALLSDVLPRGASILLMAGAVLATLLFFALQLPLGFVVFGVALIWLGHAVWGNTGEKAAVYQAAP
ncbi:MAG: hypothetical protein P8Z00_18545 [Anaerolineales bacterium]